MQRSIMLVLRSCSSLVALAALGCIAEITPIVADDGGRRPLDAAPDAGRPACIPTTCAMLSAECGRIGDGCGSALDCGSACPAGETCGGGGTANRCGVGTCVPTSCSVLGAECGLASDGCGDVLDCGSACPLGQSCGGAGVANRCGGGMADAGSRPDGGPAGDGGGGGGTGCIAEFALSAGRTCVRKIDGTLWCWGSNQYGALGDGTTVDRPSPVQVGSLTPWAEVAMGRNHTCARKMDGTLWCWGANHQGQLGNGTVDVGFLPNPVPAQVGSLTTWVEVAASSSHTCARRIDGTLWCWGANGVGQLGDGTTVRRPSPVQVGSLTTWVEVAVSGTATCARQTDRTLWCWGSFDDVSLGLSPVQVGSLTSWIEVVGNERHACARRTDGTLWCWGQNALGQLGDGTTTDRPSPAVQVGSLATWDQVGVGREHTCARRTDGTLWCWGGNHFGQLGNGTVGGTPGAPTPTPEPVQVGSLATWLEVAGGDYHTCARQTDGTLWCWGTNSFGELGDGTTEGRLCGSSLCRLSPVEALVCP